MVATQFGFNSPVKTASITEKPTRTGFDLPSRVGRRGSNVLTRDRIIKAAFDYISSREPEIGLWLGINKIHIPAGAGYKKGILAAF